MSGDNRLIEYRGKWCVAFRGKSGKRQRHSFGTTDRARAEELLGTWLKEANKPNTKTVKTLWDSYVEENRGKAVIATLRYTWKALTPVFANVRPEDVSVELCRSHTGARRGNGISDGTIWTELGHLRTILSWAFKRGVIDRAPYVELPAKPKPKERHLTRDEARKLVAGASMPHVKLFIHLALATAARKAALFDLTWDRIDFDSGMIDLRNPSLTRRHKGRAFVPMNRTVRAALMGAVKGHTSDFVIEWGGEQVGSVRRGLSHAAEVAGIAGVTPHVLRHTAAVWMAEAGRPMEEVPQYLGHSNSRMTEFVYARFSPEHLRKSAAALEFDEISEAAERKSNG